MPFSNLVNDDNAPAVFEVLLAVPLGDDRDAHTDLSRGESESYESDKTTVCNASVRRPLRKVRHAARRRKDNTQRNVHLYELAHTFGSSSLFYKQLFPY